MNEQSGRLTSTVKLTEDVLEPLYHDIAHLSGNLLASIGRMGGQVENSNLQCIVPDAELLKPANEGQFRFLDTTRRGAKSEVDNPGTK